MKIVLIIPYRGIGDLIFHIPLIRGLSQKFNTKINILTNKVNKAKNLLKNELSIKKIEYISFERENQIRNSFEFYKKVNSFNSDISILTAPTRRLIIPLLLSNSKKKIYFKKDNIKDLSKYIIKHSKIELADIKFNKDYSLEIEKNKIKRKNLFVSIDSRHNSNDWDQIYYIELINKIFKKKLFSNIYINFDPSKKKSFKKIIDKFKNKKNIFFTHSTEFNKLILIMNNCSFIIGNESGPICIGAALKKNVLSIYYPKHTNKSSKTIYNKVKFFNTDVLSSRKIIFNILKILK